MNQTDRSSHPGRTKSLRAIYSLKLETPSSARITLGAGKEQRAEAGPAHLRTSCGTATNLPRDLGTMPWVLQSAKALDGIDFFASLLYQKFPNSFTI